MIYRYNIINCVCAKLPGSELASSEALSMETLKYESFFESIKETCSSLLICVSAQVVYNRDDSYADGDTKSYRKVILNNAENKR